jgi:hypothetical protein
MRERALARRLPLARRAEIRVILLLTARQRRLVSAHDDAPQKALAAKGDRL